MTHVRWRIPKKNRRGLTMRDCFLICLVLLVVAYALSFPIDWVLDTWGGVP